MDWANTLRSVTHTVDAEVLRVLAGTHAALTGNQVCRLSGRSYAGVHAVLGRLVAEGLVSREQYGRTGAYRLKRDHVIASGLLSMLAARESFEEGLLSLVGGWHIAPVSIAMFGSAARGEATAASDVDLLVVRDDAVSEDDATWRDQVTTLAMRAEALCGNAAQIVELSRAELGEAVTSQQPLVASLRREARTIFGEDAARLAGSRRFD